MGVSADGPPAIATTGLPHDKMQATKAKRHIIAVVPASEMPAVSKDASAKARVGGVAARLMMCVPKLLLLIDAPVRSEQR
jgi:hypothetical protein